MILPRCRCGDTIRLKASAPRLSHPWFEERRKETIYPNPMSKRKVLCFFSLWNQCVGKLLHQYKPHIYHCPDFHTCIAPWYALQNEDEEERSQLRMLLVLHNAEYQGSVSTDMIGTKQAEMVARIFNVSKNFVYRHLTAEGRFNMLKAGVDFLLERQELHNVLWRSKYHKFSRSHNSNNSVTVCINMY